MVTYQTRNAKVYISGKERCSRWNCVVEAPSITAALKLMTDRAREDFKASAYAKIEIIGDIYGC